MGRHGGVQHGSGDALPEYLPLGEIAESLHTSTRYLRKLSRSSLFPPIVRLGDRVLRVRRDAYETWLEQKDKEAREAARQAELRRDFVKAGAENELPGFLTKKAK